MVNYVCRTCLYVCSNEFSFRKLEKVKSVLELFVPELKNCIGKYSLICEQCYYFLKNVEKFKVKCMETQRKLYTMNVETIRDNHDAVLRSVFKDVSPKVQYQRHVPYSRNIDKQIENAVSTTKGCRVTPAPSTATSEKDITQMNLVNSSAPSSHSNESSAIHNMVSNDLQQLLDYDRERDLLNFREFAMKPTKEKTRPHVSSISNKELIMNYNDEADTVDDEFVTRQDLVAAGVLPDIGLGVDQGGGKESRQSRDEALIEISEGEENSLETDTQNTDGQQSVFSRTDIVQVIKKENEQFENPGFFNKQALDGFYKCRLCQKQYKTSKGLYNHTKEKHSDEIKFHHCNHCSFFSLWKSALMRHCSIFHDDIMRQDKDSALKCYHCTFQSRSKEQLNRHVLDSHVHEKFTRCPLCRARFSDNVMFAQHVEKEHLGLETSMTSNYCPECSVLFLTEEDFRKHMRDLHWNIFCPSCNFICASDEDLHAHQKGAHATSFGTSILP